MESAAIDRIEEQLRRLPPEKLAVVSYLAAREIVPLSTVPASESVLRRDWDRPEEDEAWRDL